jgi:CheY-like chemotaxis protein
MTDGTSDAPAGRRPTILVVDPYEATLDLFAMILDGIGCRAITVATGSEAMPRIRDSPPDLLITELCVPEVNGYELCRAVKQSKAVPVLVVTASVLPALASKAREAGGDLVLDKPVQVAAFINAVRTLLAHSLIWEP